MRRRWRKGQPEDRFVTRYLISCCCWQGEAVSLRLYITYLGRKRGRGNVRDQHSWTDTLLARVLCDDIPCHCLFRKGERKRHGSSDTVLTTDLTLLRQGLLPSLSS